MPLLAFSIDHKHAPVTLRERLAFGDAALRDALPVLPAHAREGFVLSTCNRTEIYALADRDDAPIAFLAEMRGLPDEALRGAATVYHEHHAVAHLFRVAAGLESMILGEPQILGQVRQAFEAAREAGAAGPIIARLCHEALRLGKCARTETDIARNRLSIPHAAVDLAASRLGSLAGRAALVVGAGKMATLTARLLRGAAVADLAIANRTAERAEALARDVGGRAVPLSGLGSELARADLVVAATNVAGYVIGGDLAARGCQERSAPLLAVDLGVPRNIDPAVGRHPLVHLANVDDLEAVVAGSRARFAAEIARVEAMVAEATDAFFAWRGEREVAPTIAALHAHAERIRQAELDRALRKLGHLSPRDRDVVDALSVALVGKLLHQPVARLKRCPERDWGATLVQHLFGLDIAAGPAGDGGETIAEAPEAG